MRIDHSPAEYLIYNGLQEIGPFKSHTDVMTIAETLLRSEVSEDVLLVTRERLTLQEDY